MLIPIPLLIGGIGVLVLTFFVVTLLWFYSVRIIFKPYKSSYGVSEAFVILEARNTMRQASESARFIATESTRASLETLQNAWNYAPLILASVVIAAAGLFILINHKDIVEKYNVLRQCGLAPFRDKVLFQVLNSLALVYDVFNPFWIAYNRILAYLVYGWAVVGFTCAEMPTVIQILSEIGMGVGAFFEAFGDFMGADEPLEERMDITPALYHWARAIRTLTPILTCFCNFFDFLWIPALRAPGFISFHVCLDAGLNIFVRFLQMIIRPFFGKTFKMSPVADEYGCYVLSLGDTVQNAALQIVQIFTGIFSEIATPCSLYIARPLECEALGHCAYNIPTGICREINSCDAHGSSATCVADLTCCFDAHVNTSSHSVSFVCASDAADECPVLNNLLGCPALPDAAACLAFNGTCLWDQGSCKSHEAVCTGTTETECRYNQPFCGAILNSTECNTHSNNLCAWDSGVCKSYAQECFEDPLTVNPNATCKPLQLCGWNYNQSTCYSRDVNDTIHIASAAVNVALNIPGADAPPDTMGKLLGVPIVLAVLEIQWMHIPLEAFVGVVRIVVQIVDDIADAPNVFARYDGMAKLRIGYIFDYFRCAIFPVAQIGVVLDVDIPCTLQSLLQIPWDVAQGLFELLILLIYFSVHQPTGPANLVNLWSPFDFASSYWDDSRVSFGPLIFLNGTAFQWERNGAYIYKKCATPGTNPSISKDQCIFNPLIDYYDIIIDTSIDIITITNETSSTQYTWSNISLSGTSITQVDIFPGIDKTIPRIIQDIKDSSMCLERVLGDGTNASENYTPWACFFRHLLNIVAELLSIALQILFYITDILRFTDNPIYRKTALDIRLDGFYDEWRAASHCLTNVIRLIDPAGRGAYGLCMDSDPDNNFAPEARYSFMCCLADTIELFLSGALLVAIRELTLFLRDLIGIKFVANNIPTLPNLTAVINELEKLIDRAACAFGSIIPDGWQCDLVLPDSECYTVESDNSFVLCSNSASKCNKGARCIGQLMASILRFVLITIPRCIDYFYSTLRSFIKVPCKEYHESNTICIENGCVYFPNATGENRCKEQIISISTAAAIIDLVVNILETVLNGAFTILVRLALVFDCINCAAYNLQHNLDKTEPCISSGELGVDSGTPIFDFVQLLLGSLLLIFKDIIRLVVITVVFIGTFFAALFSGNLDIIAKVTDGFGEIYETAITRLSTNLFFLILKAMKLDKLYNSIVTFLNGIVLDICNLLNKIIDFFQSIGIQFLSLTCPEPIPAMDLGPLGGLNVSCNTHVTESVCVLDPLCIWDNSIDKPAPAPDGGCRDRVGCEAGLTRKLCADETEAHNNECIYRTSASHTANTVGVRAQQCVNVSHNTINLPNGTDPCGNLTDMPSCMNRSGICYWSESSGICSSGRDLCMDNPTVDACVNMDSLCSFGTNTNFSYCETGGESVLALKWPRGLCRYNASDNKCISTATYCHVSGLPSCSQYFTCKWDPFGIATVGDVTLTPRCVTIDMYEAFVADPNLHASSYDTGFYNLLKKRHVLTEEDIEGMAIRTVVEKRVIASPTSSSSNTTSSMPWPPNDPCAAVIPHSLVGQEAEDFKKRLLTLTQGTDFDSMGELLYCFGRILWHESTTHDPKPIATSDSSSSGGSSGNSPTTYPGQSSLLDMIMRGDCDTLFVDYYNMSRAFPWADLRPLERTHLVECVKQRALVDYVRVASGYMWIPSDLSYNPYRKYLLLGEIMQSMRVLMLYRSERAQIPSVLLTPEHKAGVAAQGLSTIYLENLKTEEDVFAMFERLTLDDYFQINSLTPRQRQMAEDISAMFGDSLTSSTNVLSNMFKSVKFDPSKLNFSDMFVNGTSDTMAQVMITSASMGVGSLLNATSNTYAMASNPEIYKRSVFATRAMGKLIYNQGLTFLAWWTNTSVILNDGTKGPEGTPLVYPTPVPPVPIPENATVSSSSILNRFAQRIKVATAFLWRNPGGAERRAKLAFFGDQLKFTIATQLIVEIAANKTEALAQLVANTPVEIVSYMRSRSADIFDPLPCLTNTSNIGTTWFCDNCLWVDQLLGRIIAIVKWIVHYFRGDDPNNPYVNFPNSYARFKNYSNYLQNDNAWVRVGDSDDNMVLFPYHNRSNWHVVGDAHPNKTRLYDYELLLVEMFDAIKFAIADPQSLLVVQLFESGLTSLYVAGSGFIWSSVVKTAYVFGAMTNETRTAMLSRYVNVSTAEVRPIGTIAGELVERLFSQFILCSMPIHNEEGELDGSKKRFALGEMLAVGIILALFVTLVLAIAFPNSMMSIGVGASIIVMVILTVFLSMVYNWSYLCFPALPMEVADDVRDLIGFTLMPKCEVLLSGTFKNFRNNNCYTCDQAKQVTSAHCVKDLHFYSIFDNIGFVTYALFPELPNILREFGLGSIIDKLTPYSKWEKQYDPTNNENFAQHWSCMWIWTLIPNLAIMQSVIVLAIIALPMLMLALVVLGHLVVLALGALFTIIDAVNYVVYAAGSIPFLQTYGESPEDVAYGNQKGSIDEKPSPTNPYYPQGAREAVRAAFSDNVLMTAVLNVRESASTVRRRFIPSEPRRDTHFGEANDMENARITSNAALLSDLRSDFMQ